MSAAQLREDAASLGLALLASREDCILPNVAVVPTPAPKPIRMRHCHISVSRARIRSTDDNGDEDEPVPTRQTEGAVGEERLGEAGRKRCKGQLAKITSAYHRRRGTTACMLAQPKRGPTYMYVGSPPMTENVPNPETNWSQ